MDNELFELCKDVYKKTGWLKHPSNLEADLYYATNDLEFKFENYELISQRHPHFPSGYIRQDFVPLYTSDYLLEKLPKELHKDGIIYYLNLSAKYGDEFKSNYISPSGYLYLFLEPESDTSLKTLLNLVIALDDAKELK